MPANKTIRVHAPLTVRKRGGRPPNRSPRYMQKSDWPWPLGALARAEHRGAVEANAHLCFPGQAPFENHACGSYLTYLHNIW